MNKYEVLFQSIYDKTLNKDLKWQQINRREHENLIFNPNLVFRQFSTKYIKDNIVYKLVLIEKKFDDPEFDYMYEKYTIELLFIDMDNELLVTITDAVIHIDSLRALASIILGTNDRINKLLN